MKNRICGALLAFFTLLALQSAPPASGIYQGYMAGGVLAGDGDEEPEIYQGYLVGGLLADDEAEARRGGVFTITFDPNSPDATVRPTSKSVVSGQAYGELPVPIRSGYVFQGWYAYESRSWITANTTAALLAPQILYAQWVPAGCTVSFDANGGISSVSAKTVTTGGAYGDLPVPTRAGASFDGWFTALSGGTLIDSRTEVTLAGDHTLYAHWTGGASVPSQTAASAADDGEPIMTFRDVPAGSRYYDAVCWAIRKGITTGTSPATFSPNDPCKQKYILTFLWRANGSPEPAGIESLSMPAGYYGKGTLWAYEKALISANEYRDGEEVSTRADTVMYLWKLAGSPAIGRTALKNALDRFTDVSTEQSFAQAVAWALGAGITNGTTDTTFSPGRTCTRGQIVTFLYRCYSH